MDDGQQEQFIPAAKIGNHNFVAVYGGTATINGGGYLIDSGDAITYALVQGITTDAGDYLYDTISTGVTPGQAFAIDTKMDDGMPATGTVVGGTAGGMLVAINNPAYPNTCTFLNGSTYYYQLSAATVDVPSCIMNFQ